MCRPGIRHVLRLSWNTSCIPYRLRSPTSRTPKQVKSSLSTAIPSKICWKATLQQLSHLDCRAFSRRLTRYTRQSEVLESPFKDGKCVALLGGLERLAAQQVAAGEVGDGQGIAVTTIGEHELALVIGAPQIVGMIGAG